MAQSDALSLRLQRLSLETQTLILAYLVENRGSNRTLTQRQVADAFESLSLPSPKRISNVFATLIRKKHLIKVGTGNTYRVTPEGIHLVTRTTTDHQILELIAQTANGHLPLLGPTEHPLVPTQLAPPAISPAVHRFIEEYPFDTNVFGMTRFPSKKITDQDPIGQALQTAHAVCSSYGLHFHLASDRALVDDLWGNVTAHMWGCRYGIAFFEDRVDRGLNHNLLIEVGAMIVTGRRCALLKDGSIDQMPTDFVGMIYKSVDLSNADTVRHRIENWIVSDLGIPSTT